MEERTGLGTSGGDPQIVCSGLDARSDKSGKDLVASGLAGEDPVLVALRYCRAHGIGEEGCAQIMQHLCRDTDLLCRSRESLAGRSQKASVVGSAMASWRTTSLDLAGLGDPVECALEVHLLDNDVEKDVELEGNATYLASLVSLHCTNLGRFRPACVCPPGVRAGLVEGLAQESERYRWSASSSHYVRLGVDARADAHEIRRAYRRVSMQVHPDRHRAGEDRRAAEYRATLVNEAYEVLSNVDSRRAYDIERFGRHFVAQTELPRYRAEVSSVFGRFAGVSMDAHGNIKIVL
ncbi:DnaJ family protein [Hondaea fermentalgiana]|uniref:DnaJ family protein n=1 Tax=Hondaea fermentalgiana TaxID=2315210 RepID=A0A2R5GL09_9STRA|nr:DnaJ family protein [Hondaea fermentalgiana]|eukprot:GBG31560.1 DnaJ family protein [Hondaea fermentalgiana]